MKVKIEDRINKLIMFHNFYNEFLLEELKTYINNKLKKEYLTIKEVFNNKNQLPIEDKILVETFMEVGKKSYLNIFLNIDLDKKKEVKIVINKCKNFFKNVRNIGDNNDHKYQQYYSIFELINTYLYKKLKKEGLLEEDVSKEDDCKEAYKEVLDVILDNVVVYENDKKIEIEKEIRTQKWRMNVPEKYNNNLDEAA